MKKILIGIGVVFLILLTVLLIPRENNIKIIFEDEKIEQSGKIKVENNTINISKGGTYTLSGKTDIYKINIDTTKLVTLILDNLSLTNESNVIEIANAENVIIKAVGECNISSNAGKAIYSKVITNITGDGLLNIASYEGIKVENTLNIDSAKLNIASKGNAIKANNLNLNETEIDISTKGQYIVDEETGRFTLIEDKYIKVAKTDLHMHSVLYSLEKACKGLNIEDTISINKAKINIDTTDDGINVTNGIDIKDSEITINTNDDGITSDSIINISNSKINVMSCYEGVEGENINIKGSTIDIVGIDDGVNIVNDNNKGELLIENSAVNILVGGDGLDIMGTTNILDSNMYINVGDNGIQSKKMSTTNSKIKSYTYPIEGTYSYITLFDKLDGEIVFAQKNNKFFLTPEYEAILKDVNTPYVTIECKEEFKIVDKDNNVIFETSEKEKEFTNYIYVNSNIEKDTTYYIVTKNSKEVLKFNNIK